MAYNKSQEITLLWPWWPPKTPYRHPHQLSPQGPRPSSRAFSAWDVPGDADRGCFLCFFFLYHTYTKKHMNICVCLYVYIYICMYIYIYTIHGWLWLLTFAINYDILRNEPIWIDLDRSGYVVNWLPHPCSVHVPSKEERNRNHWLLNNQ